MDASQIFDTLVRAQKARRAAAQSLAADVNSDVDRRRLRLLIQDGISGDYAPGREAIDADPEIGAARCWLIGTLGRIADDDAPSVELVERHSQLKFEQ